MSGVRRVVRENGLALAFGGLFLAALVGQAWAGLAEFNNQLMSQGLAGIGFWRDGRHESAHRP